MARLAPDQISEFQEQGYLVLPGLFDPARDFAAVFRDYAAVLDGLLETLSAAGEIPSTWPELGFAERVIKLHQETGKIYQQYLISRCRRGPGCRRTRRCAWRRRSSR